MERREFLKQCGFCALACASASLTPGIFPGMSARMAWAQGARWERGLLHRHSSPYFEALPDKAVRCTLCPRGCELAEGERGYCRVRENNGGTLYSLAYGNPCAVNVDPIEKRSLFFTYCRLPTLFPWPRQGAILTASSARTGRFPRRLPKIP